MYTIVSFDGGGIRGLIGAMILRDLTRRFPHFLANTRLIAGTSTGGLAALAIANGLSPEQLVSLYKTRGQQIFRYYEGGDRGLGPSTWWATYTSDGLLEVAQSLFKTRPLSGLGTRTLPRVAVCATQLWAQDALAPGKSSWMPRCMTNLWNGPYASALAVDVALATSAAPAYFPPHKVEGLRTPYNGYYADGGLTANNPSMLAYLETITNGIARPEDVVLLSIGTGISSYGIPDDKVGDPQSWGLAYWLDPAKSGVEPSVPLLELALSMNQQLATLSARQALGPRFLRVEPIIDPYPMDDYQHLAALENAVEEYENSAQWDQVTSFASQYWSFPSSNTL